MTETNKFFAEFLDDYFAECDEHLTLIRRNLLTIDRQLEKAEIEAPILEEMLRSFHSLKGLSGMVSVKEAEQLAHEMESYLRGLRSQEIILNKQGIDALITGTKMLELVINNRRNNSPPPDIKPILEQLEKLLPKTKEETGLIISYKTTSVNQEVEEKDGEQENQEEITENIAEITEITEIEFQLNSQEEQKIVEAIAAGDNIIHFEFSPMQDRVDRGINVNSIRSRLQAIGTIIHAAPRVKMTGGIVFDFLVATHVETINFTEWKKDGLLYKIWKKSPKAEIIAENFPIEEVEITPEIELITNPINREIIKKTTSTTSTAGNIVRVDLARLDELMRIVGELVISRARLEDNIKNLTATLSSPQLRPLRETNQAIERQLRDLRSSVMRVRLVPIGEVFARMEFAVRDLARENHKKVTVEISGEQTEIDKFVVERMLDPLLHLVRNAVSHGLETEAERVHCGKSTEGKLALRAFTAGETVIIEVEDDGRGVDTNKITEKAVKLGLMNENERKASLAVLNNEEGTKNILGGLFQANILDILCHPGFSTKEQADLTSGRGVGMTIVKNTVQELGGMITLNTHPEMGTRFTIQLPLTLAIADALIVSVGGQTFAVPESSVLEVIDIRSQKIAVLENNEIISYRDTVLPIIRLNKFFNLEEKSEKPCYVFVVGTRNDNDRRYNNLIGIGVDRILGMREIVVLPLIDPLVQVAGISGATELGDRQVVLILDTPAIGKIKIQT